MSKKEKLIARLKGKPKDFTFEEVMQLMGFFDYRLANSGKTGGSRVAFTNDKKDYIRMHKPHPRKELLEYQVRQLVEQLEQEGLI